MAFDPLTFRASRASIDFVLGASGAQHPIPDPMLWPDDVHRFAVAGELQAACRLIIGDDAFDDFAARGGTAAMLMEHINSLLGDRAGAVTVGEFSASDS